MPPPSAGAPTLAAPPPRRRASSPASGPNVANAVATPLPTVHQPSSSSATTVASAQLLPETPTARAAAAAAAVAVAATTTSTPHHTSSSRPPSIPNDLPFPSNNMPPSASIAHDILAANRSLLPVPPSPDDIAGSNGGVRSSPASPYRAGPASILPNFFLGNERNAADPSILRELGVGCVINVAAEVDNPLLDAEVDDTDAEMSLANNAPVFVAMTLSDIQAATKSPPALFSTLKSPTASSKRASEAASIAAVESLMRKTEDENKLPLFNTDNRIRYVKIGWVHDQDNLISFFAPLLRFIHMNREANIPVLINCQQGVNRSASLVIAYVMMSQSLGFHQAYSFVKSKSPGISPSVTFLSQLIEFEDLLKKYNAGNAITASISDSS